MVRALWAAVLLWPLALFGVLLAFPDLDPTLAIPPQHFVIVSLTSLIAGAIAVLVALAARRLRDGRAFFLALSYVSLGLVFSVHGLATPGIFVQDPGVTVGFSAVLSLFLGSIFMLLASIPLPLRWLAFVARNQGKILAVLGLTWLAFAVTALLTPQALASILGVQVSGGAYSLVTLVELNPLVRFGVPLLSISGYLFAAWRFLRSYRLSGSWFQFAMFAAAVLLAQAVVPQVMGTVWQTSWWLYHVLMLASFLITMIAIVVEYSAGRGIQGAIERVLLRGTFAQLESAYGPVLLALLAAVEAKDPYTRGHCDRVARVSVVIGEEMGLAPERLRLLAQAGVLHDVGKINVPEAILNKPDRLTTEEFMVIKKHPGDGEAIVATAGTLRQIEKIIRAHHERWDGSGYPDHLAGEDIPLEARIIAVADVYDALTSYRSYRKPWPRTRVADDVRAGRGKHFDPKVADAMLRVIDRWGGTEKLPEQLPPVDLGPRPDPGAPALTLGS